MTTMTIAEAATTHIAIAGRWRDRCGPSPMKARILLQVELVERHVPMSVENFETPLFFFQEFCPVRKQSALNRIIVRWLYERGDVLVGNRDGKCPVGAAVAVVGRHVGLHVHDASGLLFFTENRQMVPREERLKLVLIAPLDTVEVPDGFLRVRRRLRRRRLCM